MPENIRTIQRTLQGHETLEGAGVRLNRIFGHDTVNFLDPFLLLDHFGSTEPRDYLAGFPWHPHRGIQTVTYMLDGKVEHGDSLGNEGVIQSGDVQWMSSGSGIIHQEMPQRKEGMLEGFQLWINLPAKEKMSRPGYHGLRASEIPVVPLENGGEVKVVSGEFGRVIGPVQGIPIDPTFLDVSLPEDGAVELPTKAGYTTFAYVLSGNGQLDGGAAAPLVRGRATVFGQGSALQVRAPGGPLRFLLVSGRPLREPVAWYGPIVMNTRAELAEAAVELERGDFIKHKSLALEE